MKVRKAKTGEFFHRKAQTFAPCGRVFSANHERCKREMNAVYEAALEEGCIELPSPFEQNSRGSGRLEKGKDFAGPGTQAPGAHYPYPAFLEGTNA